MDKRSLTERDICTKFILPAIKKAGWDPASDQVREEYYFTKGRIIVRGKLVTRGKAKKADVVLYYKPNIQIALIEAKDANHSVGDGIQQGLEYAETQKSLLCSHRTAKGSFFMIEPARATSRSRT
jgi:type I restriction enzyme, R subunit